MIEVADLEIARIEKQLRAAEIAAHQEAIAALGAEHGPAQAEVGEIWSAIERATGVLESSCERAAGLRREAQKRTGKAREHHAAAGLPEETRPSHMLALPRSNQILGPVGAGGAAAPAARNPKLGIGQMAATIEAMRKADERNAMIAELKRQRGEAAAKLQAIDTKIEQATDADFMANLGRKELATMTLRERSMVAAKLGPERFEALITGRR